MHLAVAAVLADQPVLATSPGTRSSSTSCAACGRCCPARFSGARAFRWRSHRSPRPARIPARWSAASMRPTRRRDRRIAGRQPRPRGLDRQPARAAGADRDLARRRAAGARVGRDRSGDDRATALSGRRQASLVAAAGRRRSSSRAPCRPCRACSSPTDATPRRAADRTRSSTGRRDERRRSPSREMPNGVLNYHNAGKIQASSEPRTCACSGCSATSPRSSTERQTRARHRCGAGVTAGAVSIDPGGGARNDRRDRTARPAGRVDVFRANITSTSSAIRKCRSRSTTGGTYVATSRREVRRADLRSPGSVGEGRGNAVHP